MALSTGCTSQEETEFYPSAEISARLSANQTSIALGALSQEFTISISSNMQWTVSSNAHWCNLLSMSGAGNGTFGIQTTDNIETEPRSCQLTISTGDKSVTVQVTQSGGTLPQTILTDITEVTRYTAKVSGTVSSEFPVQECGVIYGVDEALLTSGTVLPCATPPSDGNLQVDICNLRSGTRYYVCTYAISLVGATYSEVQSFRTSGDIPGNNDNPTPTI